MKTCHYERKEVGGIQAEEGRTWHIIDFFDLVGKLKVEVMQTHGNDEAHLVQSKELPQAESAPTCQQYLNEIRGRVSGKMTSKWNEAHWVDRVHLLRRKSTRVELFGILPHCRVTHQSCKNRHITSIFRMRQQPETAKAHKAEKCRRRCPWGRSPLRVLDYPPRTASKGHLLNIIREG